MRTTQRVLAPIAWLGIATAVSAGAAPAWAQCPQDQKLTASDGAADDYFGTAACIDGDWLAEGAQENDGAGSHAGAVYVYHRDAATGSWGGEQKLVASDATIGDHFGFSVSLSGDWLAVGAPDDNSGSRKGSVYLFQNVGGTWLEKQKLNEPQSSYFGCSVSMSGSDLAVGSRGDDNYSGSVYLYTYDLSSGWTHKQKLTASDGADFDSLGVSVSLSGDVLAAGAPYDNDPQVGLRVGAGYVFCRSLGVWSQCQKLRASDRAEDDFFGLSVATDGDVIAIGSPYHADGILSGAGAAYVFRRGSQWKEEQKLTAGDSQLYASFGTAVTIKGNTIVVGAPGHYYTHNGNEGAAYVYRHVGPAPCGWIEDLILGALDRSQGDELGSSLTISGDRIVAGSYSDDHGANSGSAYLYEVPQVHLQVKPRCVKAGEVIKFDGCCGRRGEPFLLALAPFVPVFLGTFEWDWRWHYYTKVPPGLEGVTVTFQLYRLVECADQLVASNPQTVAFKFTCP